MMDSKLSIMGIEVGLKKSAEIGCKMNVAIVDAGANLLAFHRMDDAWMGSVDISIRKAKGSAMFKMPSGSLGQLSQPGGPLYGIEHSNGGLITFPGGTPLYDNAGKGKLIGAVGVSGDSVENDAAVAQAVADAIHAA